MKMLLNATLAALTLGLGSSANAMTLLGQSPAPTLIVTVGGFEWVYAGPCAGEAPSCAVTQLHNGFGFATDTDWSASFASIDEVVAAFTGKCAATYFNTVYDHCDIDDVVSGYIWHSPLAPTNTHRNEPAAETFLVRVSANPVPEPTSLALLGLGLAGLAGMRRKPA